MRVFGLLPLLAAASCGGDPVTHESLTDAHIQAMEDLARILDDIHDRGSAEAARSRMQSIRKRVLEINEAEDKLPPAEPAEQARVDLKLEDAAKTLEARLGRTMERLKDDREATVLVGDMVIEAAGLDIDR